MAAVEKLVRSKAIGIRLDAKIHYLAQLAAQEQQCTLNKFIEKAVIKALSAEAMQEDEPNVTEPTAPVEPKPLWMEGLYSADEATRFFMLGARQDLMTADQKTLWKLLSDKLTRDHGSFNLSQFRAAWDEFVGGARRDAGIEE
jgi:hypothetical protein